MGTVVSWQAYIKPPSATGKELTRGTNLTNIRSGSQVHHFENSPDAWKTVNLILAGAFTLDTAALQEHVEQLGYSLTNHNDRRLINDLVALLQGQTRMADHLKESGGSQTGDGGLWDKLVKKEKGILENLGQIGRKVPLFRRRILWIC